MESTGNSSKSSYPKLVQEALIEARELQQNLYELSGDWNYYEKDQHDYLKQNIGYSLFGAPKTETEEGSDEGEAKPASPEECSGKGEAKPMTSEQQNQLIEMIYSRILEASRTKNSLYVGIIFNILCNIRKKENKYVSPIPIFKVKRCMESDEKTNLKLQSLTREKKTREKKIGTTALYSSCVYYVDLEGRIYKNWTDYVTSNTLPKCMMVLPMGGFYQFDPNASNTDIKTYVWLEIGPSPSATQILPYLDMASTALGVGALGVGVATLALPLAAPVALAGTICGAVSGLYATARSAHQLVDRHEHQQSISPKDRTARSAWFGIVGGVAGGLASGSTFLLNKAVRAGVTLGTVTKNTYNTITIGNIVINGMGIGNGVYGIIQNYNETKEVSYLEITQVMAHILFFGNAVMNFQTAKTIITNTQQQALQEYEQSLRSNRHRKAFRRIRRNTQASNGDAMHADSEIIRGIRSIENKDDFFAGVVRNRKVLSASKAEVTFKDGNPMINDNVKFDPIELSAQPNEAKLNTVKAADPFVKAAETDFPRPNKMPVEVYNERLDHVPNMFKSVLTLAGTKKTINAIQHVWRIIFDLKELSIDDPESIIAKLAEIALDVVQRYRRCVVDSLEECMYFIWSTFVRTKLDSHLREMNIDVSKIAQSPQLARFVYEIVVQIINEIFDGVENLLENIIERYSNRPVELAPDVVKNRKVFSASKVEVTFKDGYAMINDNVKFDPIELSAQPNEVKLNTVKAAKTDLPRMNKMPVEVYNEQLDDIRNTLIPVLEFAGTIDAMQYVGRIIFDLQVFSNDDRKSIIEKLSTIALDIVQGYRCYFVGSLEECMYFIWSTVVRPKVNSQLREMNIDVSKMEQFPPLAKFIYEIVLQSINEIFKGVENLSEKKIEHHSNRPVQLVPVVCSICSGHVLRD